MLALSSGSMTPAEHAAHVVDGGGGGGGRRSARRSWACRVVGVRCRQSVETNKNSLGLENMPEPSVPSRHGARGAQGPGRRDPLRAVPRARRLDRTAVGGRARRRARPARQHGAAPPRAAARGRPGRGRGDPPRHGRPPAAPLLARRRARPGSGSTRRRTSCSPGCSPPSPSRRARTPTAGPGHRARLGRRRRHSATHGPRAASAAPGPGAGPPRLRARGRPRPPTADGSHPDRVPPLPVPRAGRGLPRAGLQPAPGDL